MSNNSYYLSHDVEKTDAMFHRLRHYGESTDNKDVIVDKTNGNRYPRKLGRFTISGIRDLTTGFDSRTSDAKAVSSFLVFLRVFVYHSGKTGTHLTIEASSDRLLCISAKSQVVGLGIKILHLIRQ